MSAFELAKGIFCPFGTNFIDTVVPDDIYNARGQLQARRKLSPILRSKAVTEVPLTVSDMDEVYKKGDYEKKEEMVRSQTHPVRHPRCTLSESPREQMSRNCGCL